MRWTELWVLQVSCLPNCCLIVGSLDVKSVLHLFGSEFLAYGLCEAWLTGPCWQITVLHTEEFAHEDFCISVFVISEIIRSQWFQQTLTLLENFLAQFVCCILPRKWSNHTQWRHQMQPGSWADPFPYFNDLQWCEWEHVFFTSLCPSLSRLSDISFCQNVLAVTLHPPPPYVSCEAKTILEAWSVSCESAAMPEAWSVPCEAVTMLDAWLFILVSASSWEASSDLCLYLGCRNHQQLQ